MDCAVGIWILTVDNTPSAFLSTLVHRSRKVVHKGVYCNSVSNTGDLRAIHSIHTTYYYYCSSINTEVKERGWG